MGQINWHHIVSHHGKGAPKITVVGGVHGDELIGERVIKILEHQPLHRGTLSLVIAHPLARAKGKRFIKQDLNRSFPGKSQGCLEERIAHKLSRQLSSSDLVVDVHATNSRITSLAIVAKLIPAVCRILCYLPVKKVALIERHVFGGKELIGNIKEGIALEYGPGKSGRNFRRALNHVRILLRNLRMITGPCRQYPRKTLYRVSGQYRIPRGFKEARGLLDFRLIHKGQLIGRVGSRKIYAQETFYPVFLGRGRYPGVFSLKAQREFLSIPVIEKRQRDKR